MEARKNNFKVNDQVCFIWESNIVFGKIIKIFPKDIKYWCTVKFLDNEEQWDENDIFYCNIFKTPQSLAKDLLLNAKESYKFYKKQLKENKK